MTPRTPSRDLLTSSGGAEVRLLDTDRRTRAGLADNEAATSPLARIVDRAETHGRQALSLPELVGPGLRTFFQIAARWKLTSDEARVLLGRPDWLTFQYWRLLGRGRPPPDTIERISLVLGIYGTLHTLFPDAAQADSWPRRANRKFLGCMAIQYMLDGGVDRLHAVRRYLASQL